MEIRDLKYLAAAASAGNFGRAAKSLGVETSTISRHIARTQGRAWEAPAFGGLVAGHLLALGKAVSDGRHHSLRGAVRRGEVTLHVGNP